jgi:hypothetical protein
MVFIVIGGCALMPKSAKGPVFTEISTPPGKSVVYFFRPDKFMLSAKSIFMSIPKQANNCFAVNAGGYYPYVAEPGKLVVHTGSNNEFTIDLSPGDVRYVKVDLNSTWGTDEFEVVPAEKAIAEIKAYRLIDICE